MLSDDASDIVKISDNFRAENQVSKATEKAWQERFLPLVFSSKNTDFFPMKIKV
jgi:FtsZ-binding cell division protein ZapB